MKKTLLALACMGILLLAASGTASDGIHTPTVGSEAPNIVLENDHGTLALADMRGQWVVLTLWSMTDGSSRTACNSYAALAAVTPGLEAIGVNLDQDDELFRETVKLDGLNPDMQVSATTTQAQQICQAYGIEYGAYGSLLVDPEGRIAAVNPSADEIKSLIG